MFEEYKNQWISLYNSCKLLYHLRSVLCEKMFYQVAIQNITHVIFIFLYLAETIPIYIMLHHEAETLPVYIVYQTFILFYPVYIAGHV